MKINKLKPVPNSSILSEQARILSEAPRSSNDDYLQLESGEGLRRALASLGAEDVEPITQKLKVIPGTPADPAPLNSFFGTAEEDLRSLYNINQSLRNGMLARYNAVASKEANIVGNLKTLRERLSSLKLYARNIATENQYITFTFSDGQQIGLPDSENVATYSEEEGALLLPIEVGSIVRPEIAKIDILTEDSTGVVGNNSDRTRSRNATIEALIDGQTHSWFEYEKIQNTRGDALRLSLRFTLKEPSIVNRIRIDPVNFGTKNWVKVEDIKIQTADGFFAVRDDISTPTWNAEEDPFQLSPAASKYAGQGLYTFSPVMAKAVQITFVQSEPYAIERGSKLRYAIGLREVDIFQVPFSTEGEFLLKPVTFKTPVRTIGLLNNVAPYDPTFVELSYQLSTDGGTTWLPISPLENVDFNKKEAITFDTPVQSVILKGKIVRDNAKFQQKLPVDLIKDAQTLTSISAPSTRIALEVKPESYLEVIRIGLGCSGQSGHPLYLGTISGSGESQVIYLPEAFDREHLHVLVNGEDWPILEGFAASDTTGVLYDETVSPAQIIFGDGDPDGVGGRIPPIGAEIYVYIDSDKKALFTNQKPYMIELSRQCDKMKDSTRISFRDLELKRATAYAGPNQRLIEIPANHSLISVISLNNGADYAPLVGSENRWEDQLDDLYGLKNGRIEFRGLDGNYYSTDWDNNIVFFSPQNTSSQEMTLTYDYFELVDLEEDDWDFHPTENKIIIRSDKFIPRTNTYAVAGGSDARMLNLIAGLDPLNENGVTLVKDSIAPIDTVGTGMQRTLESEVSFINGATEFINLQQDNLEGFYSVDYRNGIVYLPPGITFPEGQIRYMYVAAELSYGLGQKLQAEKDYTANEMVVDLTPSFIHNYTESNRNRPDRGKLLVRYDYRPGTILQDPERARFYSPVLRDITIIGVGVDPRLSTLESL